MSEDGIVHFQLVAFYLDPLFVGLDGMKKINTQNKIHISACHNILPLFLCLCVYAIFESQYLLFYFLTIIIVLFTSNVFIFFPFGGEWIYLQEILL